MKNIVIIGSSGAIGSEFTRQVAQKCGMSHVYAFSRSGEAEAIENVTYSHVDLTDEASIESAAELSSGGGAIDMVIVATGMLSDEEIMPEKGLRDLSAEKFEHVFAVNTIGPALVMKHFLPVMRRDERAIFAVLSARVGSISDNYLGGWHAYRASKAALNMLVKNASIEVARRNKQAIVVSLHPGTVNSALSKPFQQHVKPEKLFTPEYSVSQMMNVLNGLASTDSGKCFAYDGKEIAA
jgi:NAD(P)-dependent dehydrogenase (short-subunit alcohol dehydrogenase family)